MKPIAPHALQAQIRKGAGLIIGPVATQQPSLGKFIAKILADTYKLKSKPDEHFWDIAERALEEDESRRPQIKELIVSELSNYSNQSPFVYQLKDGLWSAVVSLSFDTYLRDGLQEEAKQRPNVPFIQTLTDRPYEYRRNTIPFYQLLGDPTDSGIQSSLVLTRSDYLQRKTLWRKSLSGISDRVQGDPVVVIGCSTTGHLLADLLAETAAIRNEFPRRLVFLNTDSIISDATIKALLKQNFQVEIVDIDLRQLLSLISRDSLRIISLPLFAPRDREIKLTELQPVSHLVTIVPKGEDLSPNPDERNRLFNALFSPQQLDWDPYALELPFRRDAETNILDLVTKFEESSEVVKVVELEGDSGVGKTTALRSVAFALAQRRRLVLWTHRTYSDAPSKECQLIADAVARALLDRSVPVVLFVDDPVGLRFDPTELRQAFADRNIGACLVICRRASDRVLEAFPTSDFQFALDFSEDERVRFVKYLVDKKFVESEAVAK